MNEDKIPVKDACLWHLFIFKQMVEKFGRADQIVASKDLLEMIHRFMYNVPRSYDYHVLTEFCEEGLLERINSQKYKFYGARGFSKLKKLAKFFLW